MAADMEPETPVPSDGASPAKAPKKRREVSFSERLASFRYIRSLSFAPPKEDPPKDTVEEENENDTPQDPPVPPKSALEHWNGLKSLFPWEKGAEKQEEKTQAPLAPADPPVPSKSALEHWTYLKSLLPWEKEAGKEEEKTQPTLTPADPPSEAPAPDHWKSFKNAWEATGAFLTAKRGEKVAETSEGETGSTDTPAGKASNDQPAAEVKPSVDHWANLRATLSAANPFQEKPGSEASKVPIDPSPSFEDASGRDCPPAVVLSEAGTGEAGEPSQKPPGTPLESVGQLFDNTKQAVFRRMTSVRKVMLGSSLGTPHADWEVKKGEEEILEEIKKDLVKVEPAPA